MFDDTPLLMVRDDAALQALAERLSRSPYIGVDTESDSMYHYRERVCLIQFTDLEGDIIVDPLGLTSMEPLRPIFEDPGIVKILHGADYDVVCLKRDFDLRIHNLFDTLVAAQFLAFDRLGLADLIDRYFGEPIDKQYQRYDWSRRPLLPEHLDYARGDTHFLLALRELLHRRLVRAGRVGHHAEECLLLEEKEWAGREFDPDGWARIKGARQIDPAAQRVLRQLYVYRDGQARELDRPPYKVIGDQLLIQIAKDRPTDRNNLDKLFPRQRAMKRRHTDGILDAVLAGIDDTSSLAVGHNHRSEEPDEPSHGPRARLHGRAAERVVEALKQWRNDLVERDTRFTPFAVASNSDLKAIARVRPVSLDELAEIPGIRSWQVRDHGPALLKLLDELAPMDRLDEEGDDGEPRKRRRRKR